MKNTILILLLSITVNLVAQKDTLYFDASWNKTTKTEAEFYRLLPLKKAGNLYQVKDYYANGSIQMEGYYSNVEKEELNGKAIWYYKNGQKSEARNYKKGVLDGTSTYYNKDGFLRAEGIFKNGKRWTGTFLEACCYGGYVPEFKEGKKIAQLRYYNKTNQVAEKLVFVNDSTGINISFNRDGKKLEEMLYIDQYPIDGVQYFWYETEVDNEAVSIQSYETYKNKATHGEKMTYDKNGKVLAKGIKKEGIPYSGTFYNTNYNLRETYVLGKLEGEEITYSEKGKIIAKGINKEGKPYSGSFISNEYLKYNDLKLRNYVDGSLEGEEICFTTKGKIISKGVNKNNNYFEGEFVDGSLQITSYKNGKPEGKQTKYYTANYKIIIKYHHIRLGKKEGESAYYYKDGKELSKGIYKDDKPWNGTFFDTNENTLSSYKNGEKHGAFIQFGSEGEIIMQQEYENGKITGLVKSTGYFEDKTCECEYKNGVPFTGEVCENLDVKKYKNGLLIQIMRYDDEFANVLKRITFYEDEAKIKQIIYHKNKEFELAFKDDEPYNGVDYDSFDEESITYVNGEKHGVFSNLKNPLLVLKISGNFKNGNWNGNIHFKDDQLNKKTSCTYNEGKPIEGISMEDGFITAYKDGKKNGLKTSLRKDLFFGKNYDSIARYYRNGKMHGDIVYFKEGKQVASGTYKKNHPYQGTFFDGQYNKNTYSKGDLRASTVSFKFSEYQQQANYVENTEGKDGKKILTLNNMVLASGIFKNGEPYEGTFAVFNDKEYPTEVTYTSYKKHKKEGAMKVLDIREDKILHTIIYENDIPIKESWPISFKNQTKIEGNYREGNPFSGNFFTKNDDIETLSHYEKGIKTGYQYYYSTTGSVLQAVLDSINYINGKPFDGIDLEVGKNRYHKHFYKKGKRTQTNIYGLYFQDMSDPPSFRITYTNTGFITSKPNDDIFEKHNELTYTNSAKTEGKVVFYAESEKGYLQFKNNQLIDVQIDSKISNVTFKIYLEQSNVLTVDAKNEDITIKIYPKFKLSPTPSYNDFLNINDLFFKGDGLAYFYVDKKLFGKCTLKKGNPYHGVIIRQDTAGKYKYVKYTEGERIEKRKNITKEELLKIKDKE